MSNQRVSKSPKFAGGIKLQCRLNASTFSSLLTQNTKHMNGNGAGERVESGDEEKRERKSRALSQRARGEFISDFTTWS